MDRIDEGPGPSEPCRLLIVAARRLLGEGLEALFRQAASQLAVRTAVGAEQAAAFAADFRPTVALIDLQLPRGSVVTAARSVRSHRPKARLLFLDDVLHEGRLRAALKLCGAGYVTQEDSFPTVLGAVRQVAGGGWAFSTAAEPHIVHVDGKPVCKTAPEDPGLRQLTSRQFEVLALLSHGLTVKQCAKHLRISASTADNHKSHLMAKLGVHKAVDLVRVAMREGLLDGPPRAVADAQPSDADP